MGKFVSPLLGYNNNVRHKNRVFHIQTEDSGASRPHIITHLFMDGGRILKSVKTSYAEHVGSDTMTETVRQMMKDQHKAMFVALRDGQFDHMLDIKPSSRSLEPPASSPTVAVPGQSPAAGQETVQPPPSFAIPPSAPAIPASTSRPLPPSDPSPTVMPAAAATATMMVPATVATATMVAPPPPREDTAPPPPAVPTAPPPKTAETSKPPAVTPLTQMTDPPPTTRASEHARARDLTMDFDALGAGAGELTPRNLSAPPPPPEAPARAATPPPRPVVPAQASQRPPPPSVSIRPQVDGRYASARPAAVFGPPSQRPAKSIFSDELLTDKSLDEVILSYLAEDLDPSSRK